MSSNQIRLNYMYKKILSMDNAYKIKLKDARVGSPTS